MKRLVLLKWVYGGNREIRITESSFCLTSTVSPSRLFFFYYWGYKIVPGNPINLNEKYMWLSKMSKWTWSSQLRFVNHLSLSPHSWPSWGNSTRACLHKADRRCCSDLGLICPAKSRLVFKYIYFELITQLSWLYYKFSMVYWECPGIMSQQGGR